MTFQDVHFAAPAAFLLLLAIPLVIALKIAFRTRGSLTYSSVHDLKKIAPSWRQYLSFLPLMFHILGLILIVTCIARPQKEIVLERKEKQGIAIQMLIDVSSSMDFNVDYKGEKKSRMDIAKMVLEDFVLGNEEGLGGRPNDLVGIISFARYADTVCPLTLEHEALAYIARDLETNDRPNEDGTAYGDATALAAARLKFIEDSLNANKKDEDFEIRSKVIVLLTDGVNNCGTYLPQAAMMMAKEWGIRIYTISLKEAEEKREVKDQDGKAIDVPAAVSQSDELLAQMAEGTGGIFRKAHDFESLQSVYAEIDQLERSDMRSQPYTIYREVFWPLALAAMLFLLIGQALEATVFGRIP